MTKDEARREAIRRWLELPPERREAYDDAEVYAAQIAPDLDFPTITNRTRMVALWLILEVDRVYLEAVDAAKALRLSRAEQQQAA